MCSRVCWLTPHHSPPRFRTNLLATDVTSRHIVDKAKTKTRGTAALQLELITEEYLEPEAYLRQVFHVNKKKYTVFQYSFTSKTTRIC